MHRIQGKKPAAQMFDDFEHADALAHSRQVRPQDEIAALGGCRSLSTWSPVGCRLPTLDTASKRYHLVRTIGRIVRPERMMGTSEARIVGAGHGRRYAHATSIVAVLSPR